MQGQDGEVKWVLYQLGYIGTGIMGLLGFCVSGCWLAHIIVYMLPPVPINPILNEVFIKLDGVFPLFGVAAFGAFCAYLMSEWEESQCLSQYSNIWSVNFHCASVHWYQAACPFEPCCMQLLQ